MSFPSGVQLDSESCELRYFHPIGQQYQEHILTIDKLLEWQEMDGFIPMCYVPICSDEADDSYYVRVDEEAMGRSTIFLVNVWTISWLIRKAKG